MVGTPGLPVVTPVGIQRDEVIVVSEREQVKWCGFAPVLRFPRPAEWRY